MSKRKSPGRKGPGRPAGSSRITDDLAESFGLSDADRVFIDQTAQPGAARELAGLQAWRAYGDSKRAGRSHEHALEVAAEELGIKPRQLENRLRHGRAAHDRAMRSQFEFLRGHRYRQDPAKARDLLPFLSPEAQSRMKAQIDAGPRDSLSLDEALLECIRLYDFGDGKPDESGRVAGLETVLKALRGQGISEVENTTLKPRRARR